MLQLNEFAFAEVIFVACCVAVVYQIGTWGISPFAKIAAYLGAVIFFGFWGVDAYRMKGDRPWSNIAGNVQASASDLTVIRFERGLFEVGQKAFVNVYFHYEGSETAKVRGDYLISVVKIKEGWTPDELATNEDEVWQQWRASRDRITKDPTIYQLSFPPKSTSFVTIYSHDPLTQDEVTMLSDPQWRGAVLILGFLKWTMHGKTLEVDYCQLTQPHPMVFANCRNHNGPVS